MAIAEETKTGTSVDYKQMYRNLKRKLKILIQENECFKSELRRTQGQFLQVDRDNNFLLERLMQHENCESSSSDTDATDSSDNEADATVVVKTEPQPSKRKRASESVSCIETGVSPAAAPTGGKKKRSASTSAASTSRSPAATGRNQSKAIKVNIPANSGTRNASATGLLPVKREPGEPMAGTSSSLSAGAAALSSYFTIKSGNAAAAAGGPVSAPIVMSGSGSGVGGGGGGSSSISVSGEEKRSAAQTCQLFPDSYASQESPHPSFSSQ